MVRVGPQRRHKPAEIAAARRRASPPNRSKRPLASLTPGAIQKELKVEIGVGLGSQRDCMRRPLSRRPVNGRWAVCGRFAEQVEEYRMWIEVEHLGRRQNRKFAVKMALAAAL